MGSNPIPRIQKNSAVFKKTIKFCLFSNQFDFLFFRKVHTAGGGPAANAGVLPPLRKANPKIMAIVPPPSQPGLVFDISTGRVVYSRLLNDDIGTIDTIRIIFSVVFVGTSIVLWIVLRRL